MKTKSFIRKFAFIVYPIVDGKPDLEKCSLFFHDEKFDIDRKVKSMEQCWGTKYEFNIIPYNQETSYLSYLYGKHIKNWFYLIRKKFNEILTFITTIK